MVIMIPIAGIISRIGGKPLLVLIKLLFEGFPIGGGWFGMVLFGGGGGGCSTRKGSSRALRESM